VLREQSVDEWQDLGAALLRVQEVGKVGARAAA
jgi:hypothetical protein